MIRPETPSDHAAVRHVIATAFARNDEADLVEQLRRDGDAAIALVAEAYGEIVGHVLLSKMTAPFRALGLAPLAVLPTAQRRGIGDALVRAALDRARRDGADAVFVLGDPAYYRRFGFDASNAAGFDSPYAGLHLMAAVLGAPLRAPGGVIAYAPAFGEPRR